MRFLAFLPILGLALGSPLSSSLLNKQFTHQFTSQVLTGIPELNSQYAGLRIVGKAVAQRRTDHSWKIQLLDTKYKTYNDIIKLSEEKEIINDEEVDVPGDIKKHLEAPFVLVLDKNFANEKILFDSEEPLFIANLKKGILRQSPLISFDQTLSTMVDTNSIQRLQTQKKIEFQRMENSIDGECEVQYNINKLPEVLAIEFEEKQVDKEASKLCEGEQYYEILRTKNFHKCNGRPIVQQSYGLSAKSDGSMGATSPVVSESFLERRIVCGGTYLQKSNCRQQENNKCTW